jgi:hypothetical protein
MSGSRLTSFPFLNRFRGRRCLRHTVVAQFGTISTVYYQDSPFIRFDLYV